MIAALVDNGSLEEAAHEGLRLAAARIGSRAGVPVHAVSWRHSDRAAPRGGPARTLAPWLRARLAEGERSFLFVPFLVCTRGAIAGALRREIEAERGGAGGFEASFTRGLSESDLALAAAGRVREAADDRGLRRPAVVVVDHGGPSRESAGLRDGVARAVAEILRDRVGPVAAASMEAPPPGSSRPLLSDVLASPGFDRGEVVVAPLFLLPGRHAGPDGDLCAIARRAQARAPGLRCHMAGLLGSHPATLASLSGALGEALAAAP